MKRAGFSSSPDRARAVAEVTRREAREERRADFDRSCALVADELRACVDEGLDDWRTIAPRIRARAGA